MVYAIITLSLLATVALAMLIISGRRHSAETARLSETAERRQAEVSELTAENARLTERLAFAEKQQQQWHSEQEIRFKALAAEVLNSNSALLKEQQASRLDDILKPLKENLETFGRTVAECYEREARERFSLTRSIDELVKANTSIGEEARRLSRALQGDSKVQGDWGEMILETILEKSGLRRDEEYFMQVTRDEQGNVIRNDEGRSLRPDVVVRYPDGKSIVVDSKVSLTAYVNLVNLAADATDRDRQLLVESHLRSVRAHVKELAEKRYQDHLKGEVADQVLMFIPNESAYIAAMQAAPSLWQEAFDRNVVIVSPTHLMTALRLVAQLWGHDRQTRNAVEIARQAGALYDKFAGFLNDMGAISRSIAATQKAYDSALNKLSDGNGNIMTRIENLRTLGAKASKQLAIDKK